MSNNPVSQSVPTKSSGLPNTPYPTTTMETVVGNVQVAEKSYDVQGNVVSSTQDTPIDVNALHGVTKPTEGQLTVPSTGMVTQTSTASSSSSGIPEAPIIRMSQDSSSGSTGSMNTSVVQENPQQTFLPQDWTGTKP